MKQCRFGLCPNIDAEIIEEIERISNGGSFDLAAREYLRFLHYQSKRQNMTPERQKIAIECTDNDNEVTSQENSFSSLDDIFKDM